MWDIPQKSKAHEYYNYETGEWINPTPARKLEFYSMGANLKNDTTKWPNPVVKFPTDFSNFKKANPRYWDWNKILYEYRKTNPGITIEQVKHHMSKMKVTLAFPRFIPLKDLEGIEHPLDFSEAVVNGKWDMEKVVSLYDVPRDVAYCHFKHVLQLSAKSPYVKTEDFWYFDASLLGEVFEGEVRTRAPTGTMPPDDARKIKNRLGSYFAKRHGIDKARSWVWENLEAHLEI